MEINDKLKHLTEDQLNEVIKMYLDKTIKISDILNKYNIAVQPSGLLKILPPQKTNDVCKFCGQNLYQKIESRTQNLYGNRRDKFCLNCGHHEYSNTKCGTRKCECEGCKKLAKIEIKKIYTKNKNILKFDELILEDQVKLIYLLFNNSFCNTFQIAPMGEKKIWIEFLNRMLEIHAISVSPESSVDAFLEENFPMNYYVGRVMYDVNVNFDEETLLGINNNSYFIEHNDEDKLIILLKKYIYDDLIEKFEKMLKDRRLELHISENANDSFKELINKISYTQILELCERVAVFFSDKVITGNMTKSVAKNGALGNVSKFYDRAVNSGWTLNHAELNIIGKELNFFIEKILNKDITILKEVVCVDNLRKCKKREIDYSKKIGYAKEFE